MSSNNSNTPANAKAHPKDAQLMASILKDMGVTEYEPKVINQMLEFTYRYVTDILDEAKAYSNHASKKTVDCDDVALAVHSKMDNAFTTPPPRELLLELARTKNSQPLPLIKQGIGLRLPPDRFCFLAPNYRVKKLTSGGPATVQSTPPASVTGTARGVSSSLQANAIQAALGAGRKNQSFKSTGPGSSAMMGSMNKNIPRPSMNLLSSSHPRNSQSSFTALQQQQQQQQQQHQQRQQSTPGSIIMMPSGSQSSSMGMKRKLEDD